MKKCSLCRINEHSEPVFNNAAAKADSFSTAYQVDPNADSLALSEKHMYIRLSKVVMVLSFALYVSLVAFGNITDYNSNFFLVSHVLSMDTTFPENQAMWRAINSPVLHHIAYGLIIGTEIIIAILCSIGGIRLLKTAGNAATFNDNKKMAIAGLTLGFLLWFTGFMAIGGEWFLMWQSEVANAQQAAFRLVVIIAITLVYLTRSDEEGQV